MARIAEVHVASWQAAYRDQLPDEYLQGLSVADRARRWAQFFDDGTVGQVLLAERNGVLLGFSNVGPSRDGDADANIGELYAFYLHPNSWGFGVGRVLHATTVQLLAELGFAAATLWVLATNQRLADSTSIRAGVLTIKGRPNGVATSSLSRSVTGVLFPRDELRGAAVTPDRARSFGADILRSLLSLL